MAQHLSLHRLACTALLWAALGGPARAQVVQFLGVPTPEEVLDVLTGKAGDPPMQGLRAMPQTPRMIRDTPDLPGGPGTATPAVPERTGAASIPRPTRPTAHRPSRRPPVAFTFADNFALGSAVLPLRTVALLDNTAAALRQDLSIAVLISGHTDTIGRPDANQRLSLQRAQAAKLRLVEQGAIAADRITVLGAGSTQPMPGLSPGAPENRRIQILRIVAP